MLDFITQYLCGLLLAVSLGHAFGKTRHKLYWPWVVMMPALLAYADLAFVLQDIMGIQSVLPVGLLALTGITAITLVAKRITQKRWQPRQLMCLIALIGWMIAHSVFWVADEQWLKPRLSSLHSTQYEWLGALHIDERSRICTATQLPCNTEGDSKPLTASAFEAHYSRVAAPAWQLLSSAVSACYSLGLLVLIFGHRKKRHV